LRHLTRRIFAYDAHTLQEHRPERVHCRDKTAPKIPHSYYALWSLQSADASSARTRPLWFGSCAYGVPWECRVGSKGRCKKLYAAQRIMPRTASPNCGRSTGTQVRSPFSPCSVNGRHSKTWPSCRSLGRARIYRSLK
jgi:hypothetical protein